MLACALAAASGWFSCVLAEPCMRPRDGVGTAQIHYAQDPESARRTLRTLCQRTIERSRRSPRLFVEAYTMRGLVAAGVALDAGVDSSAYDSRPALQLVDYADSLVLRQSFTGYWPLGYHAIYWADMAAAVALFPALEPFVDGPRLLRYEAAAERFMNGLRRDHMLLAGGAVGIGRAIVVDPLRQANRMNYSPYLVSTALAGISVRSWLFHRTGKQPYRADALAALDFTLGKISKDGFDDEHAKREGPLRVAAYVQEGWMAADAWLDDPSVEVRLRRALPAHVAWLLAMQAPDGSWTNAREDETSRTPPIVNFLVWYDQRFGPCEDVRGAVARASLAFTQPVVAWDRDGEHAEVMEALASRSLAALVAARHVIP
jgi:hypothetical protein